MTSYTATYSPDDNKIRLSASSRLDAETYARVKAAGFKWAPKQEIFVAPMWTPGREDLALELAGEIEDEDTSLTERAEARAERFEEYSEKRGNEADRAHAGVAAIADNIPLGQPILIGHHSEKRARKDAERIENGMRKAIKLWETSEYWERRAAGALHHAKYKELPAVRARRIKGIEADLRKAEKETKQAAMFLAMWNSTEKELTLERAKTIAGFSHVSKCFTLAQYPREAPASQYEGSMSLWSALDGGIITPEQAKELALQAHNNGNAWRARWIAHYNNRLTYEKAMLGEAGRLDLIAPKARPKQLPLVNYRQESFTTPARWRGGEMETLKQVEMTAAEYAAIHEDSRGTRVVENSHRIRIAIILFNEDGTRAKYAGWKGKAYAVFLTDSKTHDKPDPVDPVTPPPSPRGPTPSQEAYSEARAAVATPASVERESKREALTQALEAGVKVVSAPQLFPTPAALAERVIAAADIQEGQRILEPSAGTGNLVWEIIRNHSTDLCPVVAVEINGGLVAGLQKAFQSVDVRQADFLQCNGDLGKFDRIVMNPPFSKQEDITHVTHALKFLNPGGKLVAIMSAGVLFRQDRKAADFRELIESSGGTIEALPAGSFESSGTMVNSVIVEVTA